MNWKDGVIATDSGDIVARPKMSLEELLATPLGASANVEEKRHPYGEVVIRPVVISEYECCVSLLFEHGILGEVMIELTESTAKRFSFVTGYASPPDGPEVAFLEDWVRREVGKKPPVSFRWGEIGHVYDAIGGFARILFKCR